MHLWFLKAYDPIMISNTKLTALSLVLPFKHGARTSLEKRTLTNHDVAAIIIWCCGSMTRGELRDTLMAWRGVTATYDVKKVQKYDYGRRMLVPCTVRVPRMGFEYLFNASSFGGYGFVGKNVFTRGHWMQAKRWNGIAKTQKHVKGETFFRRTFWWRCAKGTYAPTMECTKRIIELKGFIDG